MDTLAMESALIKQPVQIIVHPNELCPHPLNANLHPAKQIKEIATALKTLNQYRAIVTCSYAVEVDVTNAIGERFTLKISITYILAGHGVWEAIKSLGWDKCKTEHYTDLSYDDSIYLMENDNGSSLLSTPNLDQLKANLSRLAATPLYENEQVKAMLERVKVRAGIFDGDEVDDPMAEWEGMPEFEQEDLSAWKQLKINFASVGDLEAFAELIGQRLTDKTISVWYPEVKHKDLLSYSATSES